LSNYYVICALEINKQKISTMSALKYLGVLIILIGVAVLIVPTMIGNPSNTFLMVGLLLIIGGYFSHIVLNKKIE